MRYVLFLLILFSLSSKAQTYTTAKLSSFHRIDSNRITALEAKAAIKDKNDDARNRSIDSLRQSRDLLFWENKRLKERLDSAGAYFSGTNFLFDSATKTYYLKPDTIILNRGNDWIVNGIIPEQNKMALTDQLMHDPKGDPYTLTSPKKDQDIEDYKWQIEQYEKLLDDDKKVMDKLQKKIKEQQKEIDKLKKH